MNLIYQYWNGKVLPGVRAGSANMSAYAERIGAAYRLDLDQNYMGEHSRYFDVLRPILDPEFRKYEKVAFVDLDVFAVDGLEDDIFEVPVQWVGLCEEPGQPEYRDGRTKHINGAADNRWARVVRTRWGVDVPRDEKGRVRVFNSGVVVYSRRALESAGQRFIPLKEYVSTIQQHGLSNFYALDQVYLHTAILESGELSEIPCDWNRQVHGKDDGSIYDERGPDTKFVHVQLSGADHWDAETHRRIVNERGYYGP